VVRLRARKAQTTPVACRGPSGTPTKAPGSSVEALAPGLYEMTIDEQIGEGVDGHCHVRPTGAATI
jgi:hypothetical protein